MELVDPMDQNYVGSKWLVLFVRVVAYLIVLAAVGVAAYALYYPYVLGGLGLVLSSVFLASATWVVILRRQERSSSDPMIRRR